MRSSRLGVAVLSVALTASFAQAIEVAENGVLNAASYATIGTPGYAVAPGSWVAIFGSEFAAPGELFQASSIPLPRNLGGVTVRFDGREAPLLAVTSSQINAQLPWEVLGTGEDSGTVTVVVTRNGQSSAPRQVQVNRYSPGIFTMSANGQGMAVAVNFDDGTLAQPSGEVGNSRPADMGRPLILYANGIGPVDPPAITGEDSLDRLRTATVTPRVLIGGQQAEVLFAGMAPQFVGVNQINVIVPENLVPGDAVTIRVVQGGISTSSSVTIAVAPKEPLSPQVKVSANEVIRDVPARLFGQSTFFSWQPYFRNFLTGQTHERAMDLFRESVRGMIGHYPGVGVITHDFHWKNVIGPLAERIDPTPRQSTFDTPRMREFGPLEYGQLLEELRQATGEDLDGSIQVNVMSGSAEEAADWVEYMNAPNDGSNPGGGQDWAALRALHGHPEPFRVRYWELGNEPHYTAENIGSLSAWEYVERIRAFSVLMKERDPSIQIAAYVNPFEIDGGTDVIGTATPDIPAGPAPPAFGENDALTWTQAVIRHGGPFLDMLYFHWFSAWNQDVHNLDFSATSPRAGFLVWLERTLRDVDKYAPTPDIRTRLRRLYVPEWNVFGGWFNPLSAGTAMYGALSDSMLLHVFCERPEVHAAQRSWLAAPYPNPPINAGPIIAPLIDFRPGYFSIWNRDNSTSLVPTAVHELFQLWTSAHLPLSVRTETAGMPEASKGQSLVDVTAMRSQDGRSLNIVVTNASSRDLSLPITLEGLSPDSNGSIFRLHGTGPFDNNSYLQPHRVTVKEEALGGILGGFVLAMPAYSVAAVHMTGTPN